MLYTKGDHLKSMWGVQKASNEWWTIREIPQMDTSGCTSLCMIFFLPCALKQIFRNNGMKMSIIKTRVISMEAILTLKPASDPGRSSLASIWTLKLE